MSLVSSIVSHPQQYIPCLRLIKPTPISISGIPSYKLNHSSHIQSRCCATTPTNSNEALPGDEPQDENNKTRGKKPQDDPKSFPSTIPRKPRRGRRSEAVAVEDFVRDSLERTFASIREQNPELCIEKERILKEILDEDNSSDDDDDDVGGSDQQMMVEEESQDWPLDADVGWGIRA